MQLELISGGMTLPQSTIPLMARHRANTQARLQRCWTCNESKPRDQFESVMGKCCAECRAANRPKWSKAKQAAARYRADTVRALEQRKRWKEANAIRYRSQQNEYRRAHAARIRAEVLAHYGPVCACPPCGVTEPLFLTIDHIDGNGWEHRRRIGQTDMWKWLHSHHYPPGFRVLCLNCNMGRYRNGGTCPHESPPQHACFTRSDSGSGQASQPLPQ